MLRLNPEKLYLSKWTAAKPRGKEKHFIVTSLVRDEQEKVTACLIEAVHSRKSRKINWRELQQGGQWLQGWR